MYPKLIIPNAGYLRDPRVVSPPRRPWGGSLRLPETGTILDCMRHTFGSRSQQYLQHMLSWHRNDASALAL